MSDENIPSIDTSWTLFLDRDGVINVHRPDDYVKSWDEFEFVPGVVEAMPALSMTFGRIIVVTNQRGVSKGLLTQEALDDIHARMIEEIKASGAHIHAVYAATESAADDVRQLRKPGIGMAIQAKEEHPGIDFRRSVIVGDSDSDMQFGAALGMLKVLIGGAGASKSAIQSVPDHAFDSLAAFAQALSQGEVRPNITSA